MERARNRVEFFRTGFDIEETPSKPTVSRILGILDGNAVARAIIETMKERADIAGNILAVDGKAMRSASKEGRACSALQIPAAHLTESSAVPGQEAIHDKTNEIPVFQAMLNLLDIEGRIAAADAIYRQKETCKKIIEKGGHYVFGLKKNQKTLFEQAALFIESPVNADSIEKFIAHEKNLNRHEKRTCCKITDIGWVEGREDQAGMKAVFAAERTVVCKGRTTVETCYCTTSSDASAEELLRIVREHWKIESTLDSRCGVLGGRMRPLFGKRTQNAEHHAKIRHAPSQAAHCGAQRQTERRGEPLEMSDERFKTSRVIAGL